MYNFVQLIAKSRTKVISMKINIKNKKVLFITSIPLFAGFLIYFSCRPRTLSYYLIIPFKNNVDLNSIHFSLYEKCTSIVNDSLIGNLFIYSIPGSLYSFSLAYYLKKRYLQKRFSKQSLSKRIGIYISLALILSLIPELFQFIKLLPGEYDTFDFLTAFFGAGLALIL